MSSSICEQTVGYPTPFVLEDPKNIPPRPWLYGRHLIRKNVSVTVAPGGVGKSSLSIVQALEMCTGRRLLEHWNAGPMNVWLFNLEDERVELERRICAAAIHYKLSSSEIRDGLFVDSGREYELILASQNRDNIQLDDRLLKHLEQKILENNIDVLIVDPFVSSHRVNEMDNGKMDIVTKAWVNLADRTNCSIELIHHTRKLNGVEATSDASRGASSLVNAARSSRVLQRLSEKEMANARIDEGSGTYFSVKRDKSNLATGGGKEIYRTVSVDLGQGDHVGVVERFHLPKPISIFDGITGHDLLLVQREIAKRNYRYSEQTGDDWVGHPVAKVLQLDPSADKTRIKNLIDIWIQKEALRKVERKQKNGRGAPFVEVGEWALVKEITTTTTTASNKD